METSLWGELAYRAWAAKQDRPESWVDVNIAGLIIWLFFGLIVQLLAALGLPSVPFWPRWAGIVSTCGSIACPFVIFAPEKIRRMIKASIRTDMVLVACVSIFCAVGYLNLALALTNHPWERSLMIFWALIAPLAFLISLWSEIRGQ